MADSVFCIVAAIVGAGFASGREIMAFFSQYGAFSWILILFSSGVMMALTYGLTDQKNTVEKSDDSILFLALWLLLYSAVSGSMTAAAGELAALTIPMRHARLFGMAVTLAFCLKMSGGDMGGLSWLGKLLAPGMAALFILCMRFEGAKSQPVSISAGSFLQAAGYCGLNAVLAAAVTVQAGKNKTTQERRMIAICTGLVFGGLLALGNTALLPHGLELRQAALPMVMLLKGYGKIGFYFSAAALYLAASTTLIAALRGMKAMLPGEKTGIWAALIAAGGALLGFQGIVSRVYPALGYLCLLSLILPKNLRSREQNKRLHRFVYKSVKGEERR